MASRAPPAGSGFESRRPPCRLIGLLISSMALRSRCRDGGCG